MHGHSSLIDVLSCIFLVAVSLNGRDRRLCAARGENHPVQCGGLEEEEEDAYPAASRLLRFMSHFSAFSLCHGEAWSRCAVSPRDKLFPLILIKRRISQQLDGIPIILTLTYAFSFSLVIRADSRTRTLVPELLKP